MKERINEWSYRKLLVLSAPKNNENSNGVKVKVN